MKLELKEVNDNIVITDKKRILIFNTETRKLFVSNKKMEELLLELKKDTKKKNVKNLVKEPPAELETIVVNSTECCNLKCRYCYVNEGTYNSKYSIMKMEKYLKIIHNIFEINEGGVKVIHFFGGEPLLGIENIKKFCLLLNKEYTNRNLKKPLYTMTTNGTLITEDIVDFMEEYNFKICISLDGPQNINDRERISDQLESVYAVVRKNMNLFINRKVMVACEATLTLGQLAMMTSQELYDYFDFFNSLPIKMVAIFIAKEKRKTNYEYYEKELQKFYEAYVNYVIDGIYKNKKPMIYFSNVAELVIGIMKESSYHICQAGYKQLFYSASGEVYPCQMFYSARKKKMGSADNINELKYEIEQNKKNQRVYMKCANCNFAMFCSICPGINEINNGNDLILDRENCIETKLLVSNLIWKLSTLAENVEDYIEFSKNLQEYFNKYEMVRES